MPCNVLYPEATLNLSEPHNKIISRIHRVHKTSAKASPLSSSWSDKNFDADLRHGQVRDSV